MRNTYSLYTLAAKPEFGPMLREEIRDVLAANGGVFTGTALQGLKKLDSFIREDMRVNSLGGGRSSSVIQYATWLHRTAYTDDSTGSFRREVLKPFTLPSGQRIPAGAVIIVPASGINQDDSVYPNADNFDPLRFYNLRGSGSGVDSATATARNQMVSVNTEHLTFGFGKHACPGRFFAANEIKMIMANILMNYDVGLVGDATERYPNLVFASQHIPDPTKSLRFRRAVA